MTTIDVERLKFGEQGLITAVIQEATTGRVLMVAYMNKDSLAKTIETGETYFWSRSRNELWHKGETSGSIQKVKEISFDCDADALLVQVEQKGNACHTGAHSCFFTALHTTSDREPTLAQVLVTLAEVIRRRKSELPEGSYTTYLFQSGLDKILKKVGEEAAETIIAAKNRNTQEIVGEVADLFYHLLVLLEAEQVPLSDIARELSARAMKNKKQV